MRGPAFLIQIFYARVSEVNPGKKKVVWHPRERRERSSQMENSQ
jgi:hypothetical protein